MDSFDPSDLTLSLAEKSEIVNILVDCPVIVREQDFSILVEQLDSDIRSSMPDGINPRTRALYLVNTCLKYKGGIEHFIDVLQCFVGESSHIEAIRSIIDGAKFEPSILNKDDLRKLKTILSRSSWKRYTEVLLRSYKSSVKNTTHSLLFSGGETKLLGEIVRNLSTMGQQLEGNFPIIEFVERVAHKVADIRQDLREWVDLSAQYLNIDTHLIQSLREEIGQEIDYLPEERPYLILVLEGQNKDNLLVRSWLCDGTNDIKRISLELEIISFEMLPMLFDDLVFLCRSELGALRFQELSIEIFTSHPLLCKDFDQIEIMVGVETRDKLGKKHPIAIRSLERASIAYLHSIWLNKWEQIRKSANYQDAQYVLWVLEQPERLEQLQKQLENDNVTCLALLIVPGESVKISQLDILKAALNEGIPAALVLRKPLEDLAYFQQACRSMFTDGQIPELPHMIWEKRTVGTESETNYWNSVTLLWDDPERVPPDLNPRNRLSGPRTSNARIKS